MWKTKKASNHTNFMTEKERNYVSFCLCKNIKKGIKQKDFFLFFNPTTENHDEKKDEQKKKIAPQIANPDKKKIIKEILTKTLVKTNKKSRKTPRPMIKNENIEISETLNYMIKLEGLFDQLVIRMYNLQNKTEEGILLDKIEFVEDDFFYYLDFQKFFIFLKLFFKNYDDDDLKKKILLFLLQYCIKIKDITGFKKFVTECSQYFPMLDEEEILQTDYFNYFYFNVCNFILGAEILTIMPYHSSLFFKYLSNDNLDLIFSLDYDEIAWQFLATLIKLLDDEEKAVVVVLIKDKVIETVESNNKESMEGLTIFLDAIGLETKDLL